MKSILSILLSGLLTVFVATRAYAWEFKLSGTWLWGYDYIDQAAGGAGFFGPHDLATAGLSESGTAESQRHERMGGGEDHQWHPVRYGNRRGRVAPMEPYGVDARDSRQQCDQVQGRVPDR